MSKIRKVFTKDEDLYIIEHAYFDQTFSEIAIALERPVYSVYMHMNYIFGKINPCENDSKFDIKCSLCKKNREKWLEESKYVIRNRNYNRRNSEFYTKEDDLYLIEHAYNDMTLEDISYNLNRNPAAAYTRIQQYFGSPSCEEHRTYNMTCKKCIKSREDWAIKCRQIIQEKKYPNEFNTDIEISDLRKKKQIKDRTESFSEILGDELFEDILNFVYQNDILKGRQIENVFLQAGRIFIADILNNWNYKKNPFPCELINFFFDITPDIPFLFELSKIYTSQINPEFHPMNDKLKFCLKDICHLSGIYEIETCHSLFFDFLPLYKKIDPKEGTMPAILYLYGKNRNIKYSQTFLASQFGITEVSLRKRIEYFKSKTFEQKLNEIFQIFDKCETISCKNMKKNELIEDQINQVKKCQETHDFLKLKEILILTNSKSELFNAKIIPILQQICEESNTEMDLIVLDYIIKEKIVDEQLFGCLIQYLGDSNLNIAKKVIELIDIVYPNVGCSDIYSKIDNLKLENKLKIYYHINKQKDIIERVQNLKIYLQESIQLSDNAPGK